MQRSCPVFTFILVVMGFVGAPAPAAAEPLHLILPTSNDALLYGDGPAFYMYTDRYFKGRRSQPWEGGQYGFVRNAKETPHGIVYTRFHEGVDIRPRYRDAAGEPLDTVRTIDDGYVVYVNNVESFSNYGKYVVVEHWWSGAPFYSLYAHLGTVYVREGQQVVQGQRLARMGHTGTGIDRRRAHVHFEINMLLNQNYGAWHRTNSRGSNRHDVFHGYNLAGLDVPALYLALQNNPNLTIEDFFALQEPFYSVAVPNEGPIDLLYRYPFLAAVGSSRTAGSEGGAPAWEIGFTQSGLPVRIAPSSRRVAEATATRVQPSDIAYSYLTGNTLTGSGRTYALSSSGQRFMSLLTLPAGPGDDRWQAYRQQASATSAAEVPPVRRVNLGPPQPVETSRPAVERLTSEEAARRVARELRERQETREREVRGW